MTDLDIRPLVAGEEDLFDSLPDPLPQLRKVSYADGLAGGGYRPEHTWIARRDGRVVARAAWLLPPGAPGRPWLEQFDTTDAEAGARLLTSAFAALGGPTTYHAALPAHWRRLPDVSAVVEPPMAAARLAGLTERGERLRCSWTRTPLPARSGRYTFRPAESAGEINGLLGHADILTGREIALAVGGVDLETDPLAWISTPPDQWRVAERDGVPVGLAGPYGDACYPMISYLGTTDEAVRGELLADACRVLKDGGAYEVLADVDSYRVGVLADLERTGFRQIRTRVTFN